MEIRSASCDKRPVTYPTFTREGVLSVKTGKILVPSKKLHEFETGSIIANSLDKIGKKW